MSQTRRATYVEVRELFPKKFLQLLEITSGFNVLDIGMSEFVGIFLDSLFLKFLISFLSFKFHDRIFYTNQFDNISLSKYC